MICPVCRQPMIVVEYRQIELDYCQNCKGVWFDKGELELLLEHAGIPGAGPTLQHTLLISEAKNSEKRRRCPICRHTMKKVNVAGDKHVLLDACVRHDGIWFDGGEVDHLIEYVEKQTPGHQGHGEVFNFIKEVFRA